MKSIFKEMVQDEILNEYQSYWMILKEKNISLVVLANTMRNILEYFFGFIGNKKLGRVFDETTLQDVKYKAFFRYINRESHSDIENAFDMKDFNHDNWMQCFQDVFEKTGNKEHYEAFMK